ncbi:MAG: RNA polymerase subunit sigma [Lachnospiraceae bacterium]|nr:RNA polymerase subunit sigma [Lachnospiraceae bacterium]
MATSLNFDNGIKKIEICNLEGELLTVLKINTADADTAKKFVELANNLEEIANSGEEKAKECAKKYSEYEKQTFEELPDDIKTGMIVDASNVRIEVLKKMIAEIDGLFGKDTIHNVFRECYEISEDFVPDEDALIDFVNKVMPVMNDLFDLRAKAIRKNYNPNRKKHNKTKDELIQEHRKAHE